MKYLKIENMFNELLYFVRMNLYKNDPVYSSFSAIWLYIKYFDAVLTYQHQQLQFFRCLFKIPSQVISLPSQTFFSEAFHDNPN